MHVAIHLKAIYNHDTVYYPSYSSSESIENMRHNVHQSNSACTYVFTLTVSRMQLGNGMQVVQM